MEAELDLSLCLIARDSARTLAACLESIRPWVDEMIVVDTGSLDETPTLAQQLGARVFEFPWCDDFSAARNESLRHGRGRWLFWMDSDDTIDSDNGRRLRELAKAKHPTEILGFVMQVHCPGAGPGCEGDCTVVDHVKVISNLSAVRFDGRIHEQILPAIRRCGGDVGWTDIFVVHSGSDQSSAGRKRKQERDLRLLLMEIDERPEHPFTLFNLGMTYADMEDHGSAIAYLNRSIAASGDGESHLRKAYALLVNSYAQSGDFGEARACCERGRQLFSDDPELLFRQAMLAHRSGHLQEAEQHYLHLIRHSGSRHFSSVDPGIMGHKSRHNLAAVYADSGRFDLAELQWRQILADRPKYRAAWHGLVECLLRLGRLQTAFQEIERMDSIPGLVHMVRLERTRVLLADGDIGAAKSEILHAILENPGGIEPLEAYCRFLFEHGHPYEAKLALAELSRRVPDDGAILHNLGAVHFRLGLLAEASDAYTASLEVRPDSPATLRELAAVLTAQGRLEAAQAVLIRAAQVEDENIQRELARPEATQII